MRLYLALLLLTAAPVFAAQQSQHVAALSTDRGMVEFQKIIDSKCTVCHTRERIDNALARRADVSGILERMKGLGAKLSPAEQEMLTAYWNDEQFAEVNQIINNRCTSCHSRQRIDQALANGENLAEIQQKMIRFGAKLSSKEQNILGVFSGKAFK